MLLPTFPVFPTTYPQVTISVVFPNLLIYDFIKYFPFSYQYGHSGLTDFLLRASDHRKTLLHEALDSLCVPHFHFSLLCCNLEWSEHAPLSHLFVPNRGAWQCVAASALLFEKAYGGWLHWMLKVWFVDVDIRTKNVIIENQLMAFSVSQKKAI